MLHLTYSNRTEELASALGEALAAARNGDPFAPASVVVPNQLVATYLKLHVARTTGIAANLRFPFLESYLGERGRAAGVRVLERTQLHALLCSLLDDPTVIGDPELAPVRAYVGDESGDAADLRRFQLAGQLATLFSEYALARPDLVAGWSAGVRPLAGGPPSDTESWQRALWRTVRARLDRLDDTWMTLPELFDRTAPDRLDVPPHLFVFGWSYLAPGYYRILSKLAEVCELHLFCLNPCREFWEDAPGRRGAGSSALALWGRPGRDNVRLLNQLADFSFAERFVAPAGDDALGRLGRDILERLEDDDADDLPRLPADDSVRVLACPNPQRELEIIGSEIWRQVRERDCCFNDIAVLINPAELDRYQAHIGAVFRELHDLPHHLVDVPLTSESRIAEAFELLLDLPFGRFARPELLGLVTHPNVIGRYPDVEPADWVAWAERLGIVHGADRRDHEGTYIERDVYNWEQGIRRLALGAFMAQGPDPQPLTLGGAAYVPEPLDTEATTSAARLALFARSLIADARFAASARMPLSDWRGFLELVCDSYLTPRSSADERTLERIRQAVGAMYELDLDGRDVPYRVAAELARARVHALSGARGEPLADGVMVAPLSPMRALPFKVVFVCGLGEGRFPTRDRESPLDLRTASPRPGDVSPRERDRYLFLETVLAARERLFLSYVARDEQTGEHLEPSSVVTELCSMIESYLEPQALAALTERHPLRRYDPRYFPRLFGVAGAGALHNASPSAERQARALALRRDLARHLGADAAEAHGLAAVRARVEPQAWPGLDAHLELTPARAPASTTDEADVSIPLWALRKFLERPEQAWASAVLGLRESELDDLVARADEPFEHDKLGQALLLRRVFAEHLAGGGGEAALLRRYNDRAILLEQSGRAPIGAFAALARDRHHEILRQWHRALEELGGVDSNWRRLGVGRAPEHRHTGDLLPPIQLEVARSAGHTTRVELYGQTNLVADGPVTSLVLAAGGRYVSHRLRGFFDQVVLAATGERAEQPHRAVNIDGAGKAEVLDFAPWTTDDARAYLATLAGDMLDGAHDYLLPDKVVFNRAKKPTPIHELVTAWLTEQRRLGFSFGPLERLEQLRIPGEAEAAEVIERRFGPYFQRLEASS